MKILNSFFLLGIFISALFSSSILAEQNKSHDAKFWQLVDPEINHLQDVIATPMIKWNALNDGFSDISLFSKEYWQATQGQILWLKIELPRQLKSNRLWIELIPNVGLDGQLAIFEDNRWLWELPIGRQNSSHSELPATFLTFLINEPKNHQYAYLKLQTSQVFNFNIQLRTDDEYITHTVSNHIYNGFIFGFLALAIIYNLVIGISANEKLYLYYAFYVFCLSLYLVSMSGYSRLAFPEWGGSGSLSNLTIFLAIFAANIFIRELLDTKNSLPKVDIILRIQQISLFICIFLTGFVSDLVAYCFAEFIGILAPVIVFIAGIAALKQNNPIAPYFLISWMFFIFCGFLWALMWLGFVEASITTLKLLLAGSAIEVMLLSLLIGYRFGDLKKQAILLTADKSKYQTQNKVDSLTGIYNRHGLISTIKSIIDSSTKDLIWLEINIDNFKAFNNIHGHTLSDQLLAEFGSLLDLKVKRDNLAAELIEKEKNSIYRRGVVGRVSGGEFSLLLSNTSLSQARLYAERLIRDFENLYVTKKDGTKISSTISIGIITVEPGSDIDDLLIVAKNALNTAKKQGLSQLNIQI